jgi:hypothetical protein
MMQDIAGATIGCPCVKEPIPYFTYFTRFLLAPVIAYFFKMQINA